MASATVHAAVLTGMGGHIIDVQTDISDGLVATAFVGRPDSSVNEARDRCRSALVNSGFGWPSTRRVTVLFAPADIPKRGPHLDLAIALSVLCAQEVLEPRAFATVLAIGELDLDGALRAVTGVLPMVMLAKERGLSTVLVPESQVAEASLVQGVSVVGVRSLLQAAAWARGDELPDAAPIQDAADGTLLHWRGERRRANVDLADLNGLEDARFALEVAAAGGHHLLLLGPKGSGKTSLAERLVGLLPDLGPEEQLELAAVRSLAGEPVVLHGSDSRRPPLRAPHHSASMASLLGGGSGRVHPGELSKAHHGVLFLDEFPHFRRDLIEALREPLDHGEVSITRADESLTLPARSLLVLAANPCPCGEYTSGVSSSRCACGEVNRRRYREKMRGPVLDRIDITRHVMPAPAWESRDHFASPESSATVRQRVQAARARAATRWAGTDARVNGDVSGALLAREYALTDDGERILVQGLAAGKLSRRAETRLRRVAWTVADLHERDVPGADEVKIALALRLGEPLPAVALSVRAQRVAVRET